MTEREMIVRIESAIHRLRDMGFATDSVERFFDVGEWLIAFEGLESLIRENRINDVGIIGGRDELGRYFNYDPPEA